MQAQVDTLYLLAQPKEGQQQIKILKKAMRTARKIELYETKKYNPSKEQIKDP